MVKDIIMYLVFIVTAASMIYSGVKKRKERFSAFIIPGVFFWKFFGFCVGFLFFKNRYNETFDTSSWFVNQRFIDSFIRKR